MSVWLPLLLLLLVVAYLAGRQHERLIRLKQERMLAEAERRQTALEGAPAIEPPEQPVLSGTYRRRPVMVEAKTWDGSYVMGREIEEWAGSQYALYQEAVVPEQANDVEPTQTVPAHLFIYCPQGAVEVFIGDTVVREEFASYPFTVVTANDLPDLYELLTAEERA